MVVVISSEGTEFEVDSGFMTQCGTIKGLLEDIPDVSEPIHLNNIRGEIIQKILIYCQYHKDHPVPPVREDQRWKSDNISEWDQEFMKVENRILFEIMEAANFLELETLVDLGCKTIANKMKGKTIDEIKEIFEIPDWLRKV